jgi:hypothetical protein
MSIRLDPRHLSVLKQLAGEAGMRPGELVTSWVVERIDAARGAPPPAAAGSVEISRLTDTVAKLGDRLEALSRRVDEMSAQGATAARREARSAQGAQRASEATPRKRRGRPPKSAQQPAAEMGAASSDDGRRVPLHQAIISVINEHGPLPAADIAQAISEEGIYRAPRSDRPLDAATVNSRVSNPVYRSLFRREDGRIALASGHTRNGHSRNGH